MTITDHHWRRIAARVLTLVIALGLSLGALAALGYVPARAQPADPSPSFAIISPKFNGIVQGPVGAYVTAQAPAGSGWTPGATLIFGVVPAGSACNPSNEFPVDTTVAPPITVQGDGSFTYTFAWPTNANQNNSPSSAYAVCAQETNGGNQLSGMSTNTYTVLTNAPPTITVTPMSAHVGDQLTVTGQNWLPVQTITLSLRLQGSTYQQDQGDVLSSNVQPDSQGNFQTTVTLPGNRIGNSDIIMASVGVNTYGHFPLEAMTAQTLDIAPALTPTPTDTPSVTASPGANNAPPPPGSNTTKLLIALLGLIAVVLLVAGIVVAVLALRGRNMRGPGDEARWASSTPRNPGWDNGYGPGQPWDETVAGGPGQGWDDGMWQPGAGQPWSGRESRAMGGPMIPPAGAAYDDDEDDRYRTQMGEPYQPPVPPQSRPFPPPSRPNPPPRSMPRSPASSPGFDDYSDQDTGQGPAYGPNYPPPRR